MRKKNEALRAKASGSLSSVRPFDKLRVRPEPVEGRNPAPSIPRLFASQNEAAGVLKRRDEHPMMIEDAFRSEIHAKIIAFFHENQASIETPRGVATWIKEERFKVKPALEELVLSGILIAHRAPSTTGYSYTRAQSTISRIEKLLRKAKGPSWSPTA